MTEDGAIQGSLAGEYIHDMICQTSPDEPVPNRVVYIHTSPFLRCIQTALEVAKSLGCDHEPIRVDAWLGEWMTKEYFEGLSRKPPNMWTMVSRAKAALDMQGYDKTKVSFAWDGLAFGSAEYGEKDRSMKTRFLIGLEKLVSHYTTHGNKMPLDRHSSSSLSLKRVMTSRSHVSESSDATDHETLENDDTAKEVILICISHASGITELVRQLSGRPVLSDIEISSLSMATLKSSSTQASKEPNSLAHKVPKLQDYTLELFNSVRHLERARSMHNKQRKVKRDTTNKDNGIDSLHHHLQQLRLSGLWTPPDNEYSEEESSEEIVKNELWSLQRESKFRPRINKIDDVLNESFNNNNNPKGWLWVRTNKES